MEILLGLLATLSSISITSNCHYDGAEFGGVYRHASQSIEICDKAIVHKGHLMQTIYHELAHHYWFTVMPYEDREEYKRLYDLGEFYITPYAETRVEEDFAEMFASMLTSPMMWLYRNTEKYKFVERIFSNGNEIENN